MAYGETTFRHHIDDVYVAFSEGDESRRELLKKQRKYRIIGGETYFCFIDSKTQKEEWFYCPKSRKVSICTADGKVEHEYMCLGYNGSYRLPHKGRGSTFLCLSGPNPGPMTLKGDCFLREFGNMNPFVISSKGYNETDVVCLYRVDMDNIVAGQPVPIIDYQQPYLAHAGEEIATPLYSKRNAYNGEGCQISDDGKRFRTGVVNSFIKNPEDFYFREFEIVNLKETEQKYRYSKSVSISTYSTTDVGAEREKEEAKKERERARREWEEEVKRNNKRTKIENDRKIETMRKKFPRKQMRGQPEFFLIEDPKTKEQKWYYCPKATIVQTKDPNRGKTEEYVSLGMKSTDLLVDDGKARMSTKAYESTDIVLVFEVKLEKGKKPVIKRDKYYIIHLDTMDMIECSGSGCAYISSDSETMKVRNPFATDTRFDLISTRTNETLDTHVSGPSI